MSELTEELPAAVRPLRADARRNRDLLVEIATAAFAEVGTDVALEDIARRAGVGIGTLYRHFPTREALVLAVYMSQIEGLRTASIELLKTHAPGEALHEWMRTFVGYAEVKRGMVALLRSMMATDSTVLDEAREIMRSSAQSLIDAAVEAGAIRRDLSAPDLIRAIGGVCMMTDRPATDEAALVLVDLIYDGLRYGVNGVPTAH